MAVKNKCMDAAAELGSNPVSKHKIRPEYGDEQADAGRSCRNRLARSISQARTWTGKYSFSCLADHKQDWQPYPVDRNSCYMCDHIHTYIHNYKPILSCTQNVFVLFLSGVPAWRIIM